MTVAYQLLGPWDFPGKNTGVGCQGPEEKGTTEDEMAGWHHRLNGHEFE